jgi:hypothetical protein
MANQSGPGRQGNDNQRQDEQQGGRRAPGGSQGGQSGNQGGQSGKNAGPVLPEGEKVGEWSDDESGKE